MDKDNYYEWFVNHRTTEPDIYFDEEEEEEELSETQDGARIIITMFVDASQGDPQKLYALMCIFAGMTLREASKICGQSHEWIRQHVKSVEKNYPELYKILVDRKRELVPSLVPQKHYYNWTVTDTETGKSYGINSLKSFVEKKLPKMEITIKQVYNRAATGKKIDKYEIKDNRRK